MKKIVLAFMCFFSLTFVSMGFATTIDLLPLFDTNGNGEIYFGDGFSSIPPDLDHFNLGTVTATFDLADIPLDTGSYTFWVTASGIDYRDIFSLNGGVSNVLRNGTLSFTGSNADLLLRGNTVTFNIGASGSNLDDFKVTAFTIEYAEAPTTGSSVPEPTTFALFGLGCLGFARIARKGIL